MSSTGQPQEFPGLKVLQDTGTRAPWELREERSDIGAATLSSAADVASQPCSYTGHTGPEMWGKDHVLRWKLVDP